MTDRYAVIGNPIAHSQSPRLHQAFAQQTAQDLSYEAILATNEGFEQAVRAFREAGGRGMNVTVPFKVRAFALSQHLSPRVELAGAVNTLTFDDDVRGANTDGVGLVRDLETNYCLALRGKRVLILGAGGATAGVLGPLLEQGVADLVIANRTPEKAKMLAQRFAALGPCRTSDFNALSPGFDLVINATSSGLQGERPAITAELIANTFVYDLMYGDKARLFLDWAKQHGAAGTADGMGMLVEQAAESFFLWRGVRPQTAPVLAMMRDG